MHTVTSRHHLADIRRQAKNIEVNTCRDYDLTCTKIYFVSGILMFQFYSDLRLMEFKNDNNLEQYFYFYFRSDKLSDS